MHTKSHQLEIRGAALITALLFTAVVVMLLVTLLANAQRQVFQSQSQHHSSQALYLAEAGMLQAIEALENDLSWGGTTDASIPGIQGTYEVRFGPTNSVNNLGKTEPADSILGEDSIPPNSAFLVVKAQIGLENYILRTIIGSRGSAVFVEDALLSSGKIRLRDSVLIDGQATPEVVRDAKGSIQSNLNESEAVSWRGTNPLDLEVTGVVGSPGDRNTINLPESRIAGGKEPNSTGEIPHFDIQNIIAEHTGAASPTLSPNGVTRIGAGDHYLSSDTIINGDIILEEGGHLYVDGSLEVNGSISGVGSVYVEGETTFKGDSVMAADDDFNVAIYSQGHVKLTGFDGTQYITSRTQTAAALRETADALDRINGQSFMNNTNFGWGYEVRDGVPISVDLATYQSTPRSEVHQLLAGQGNGRGRQILESVENLRDGFIDLGGAVSSLQDGPTKSFLVKRIGQLETLVSPHPDFPNTEDWTRHFLATGDKTGFIYESIRQSLYVANSSHAPGSTSAGVGNEFEEFFGQVNQIDYDRIGNANFQGLIYTNGFFYADNDISVLGAIVTDGNPTLSGPPELLAGEMMEAGDVYLGGNTRLTYVESLFKNDDQNILNASGQYDVKIWMGR